jgi:N-acetylmuramoyl-L-alanine amidase
LAIANKVADLLRRQPDMEVFMTRNRDYFVTLKGRTQFANKHHADLFVSIHCNSTPRSKAIIASGSEIYVYSPKASSYLGNVETNEELVTDSKTDFMGDLHSRIYRNLSINLAEKIWRYIKKNLGQHMRRVQPKNFYVLGRVNMPSILIETAFISNPKEEFKLRDPEWQDKMARSIADGILAFKQAAEGGSDAP